MNKEQISRYIMFFFGLACLVMLTLTTLSLVPSSKWFGQDKIITQIDNYLNESQKLERQDLITLLELETLLSPIQHSDVGISFIVDVKVGIGEMLRLLNELISDSAKISIFAISAMEVIKYIIAASEAIIPWLFAGVLLAGGVFGLCHSFSEGYGPHIALCNKITKTVVVLFFVFHILLPYSLFTASIFSKGIIDKDRTENRTMLHNLHKEVKAMHKKEDFRQRAENSIDSFEKITLKLPHKVELMAIHHTKHIAMTLFKFIILPIALFLISVAVLIWGIRVEDRAKVR